MNKKRSLIAGFGVNNADYPTATYELCDGKYKAVWVCKAYKSWLRIIKRCYNEKSLFESPTYYDCSVSEDWKYLLDFKDWYDVNYVDGWHLDKDVLVVGNRVYGPKSCAFIPYYVNNAIINKAKKDLPWGVSFRKMPNTPAKPYRAYGLDEDNKPVEICRCETPEEAHVIWQKSKAKQLIRVANRYAKEPTGFRKDVYEALLLRVANIEKEILNKKETIKF